MCCIRTDELDKTLDMCLQWLPVKLNMQRSLIPTTFASEMAVRAALSALLLS